MNTADNRTARMQRISNSDLLDECFCQWPMYRYCEGNKLLSNG